jgi:hypothetical protein
VGTQTAGVYSYRYKMVLYQAGTAYAAPPSTNQYRIRGISQKWKLEPAYFATFHTFTVGPVKGDWEDEQVEYGIGN